MTREDLRCFVLEGEEGVKACQEYIMSLIHTAAITAIHMTSKLPFSHEQVIIAYQFAIDIMKRLFSDDNVGFYVFMLMISRIIIVTSLYSMRSLRM